MRREAAIALTGPNAEPAPVPLPETFTEAERRENDRLLNELVELIASGEAVAFVGAGSSISAGFASWSALLGRLTEVAQTFDAGFATETPSSPRGYLDYANRIRDCIVARGGRGVYHQEIAKIFFRPMPFSGLKQFHRDLVRLPFRAFVTTNYDNVLEATLAEEFPDRPEPQPVPIWNGDGSRWSPAFRAVSAGEPIQHVIHIHGHFHIGHSIILCTDDYVEAYGFTDLAKPRISPVSVAQSLGVAVPSPQPLFMLVSALLATRRLVFVGFSWQDEFFAEVLSRVSDALWEWHGTVHFTIYPTSQKTKAQDRVRARRLKEKMGIETVFYEVDDGDIEHIERDKLIQRVRTDVERLHADRGIGGTTVPPARATAAPPVTAAASSPATTPTVPATPTAKAVELPAWVAANNARQRARIENED